jgi:uncharacterized protein (TIGR03086 family)
MTTISTLLREAADAGVPVLRGLRDSQLDDPTPCSEFRVRDLVNHLYQVVVNFQALARREKADFASIPDVVGTSDWRSGFAGEVEKLIAAWADPTALDGVSPGMGLPQPVVGQMVLLDLTLHPWDLARATGQPYAPSKAAVKDLHAMVDMMAEQARAMKVFGPPVQPPPGADDFELLLAKAGRDPMWTAAAGR